MTRFPIVQRELLVSARKPLTFWTRMGAAILAFGAVVLIVGIEPDLMIAGALGAKLFRWLTIAAFCACLFGGALLTADCLSSEKREGTLGLLFLTDLKGYDVVLGKLVAKSIPALLSLLAIFPMLALPILLGGVTGGDFWRMVMVLLNTLFLSASVGMLTSVLCREARNAFATAEFFIFLLVAVPTAFRTLDLFNPLFAFIGAMPGSPLSASQFHGAILALHALGWLCVMIASVHVQTSWQEKPASPTWREHSAARAAEPEWCGEPAWHGHWRDMVRGDGAERLALRRSLLSINPVLWLESRNRSRRVGLVFMFVLLATCCWFINHKRAFHWSDIGYSIWTVLFLHVLLKLLVAYHISARIIEAKRDGALTVVLSTRMSVEDVLHGEFLAAKRLFRWPLFIVLLFDAIWMFGVGKHARGPFPIETVFITLCLVAVLITNCWALVWTALHNSMRARRHYRGALLSFAEIVVAPLIWAGLVLLGAREYGGMMVGVMVFTILNFVNTWLFGSTARERFKTDLRQTLTEHPRPPEKSYDEDYALLK